jgi:hypothetical protein
MQLRWRGQGTHTKSRLENLLVNQVLGRNIRKRIIKIHILEKEVLRSRRRWNQGRNLFNDVQWY